MPETATPAVAPPPPAPDAGGAKGDAVPTAAEIRKLKLRRGDREFELPEEDVIELASANGKFLQEAAQAKRDLEKRDEHWKTNWRQILKEQGIDARELILKEYGDQLQAEADEETLSPSEKELKALKRQWAEREESDKRSKEEESKKTLKQKTEEHKVKLRATVDEVVQAANLPNSNFVKSQILQKYEFNKANGLPTHPTVLAAEVREDMAGYFRDMLSGLTADHLWQVAQHNPTLLKEFVRRYAESKGAKPLPKPEAKPAPKTQKELRQAEKAAVKSERAALHGKLFGNVGRK